MSEDKLITCPRCGSDACYETQEAYNLVNRMCYGCGFMTHNYMKEDSEFLNEQLEVLPELYKDLVYEDKNGQHWMPSTINNSEQGMIFIDGTSTDDWRWAACKAVELTEEEAERFPEGTTHKMDMKNVKHFEERDFMEALDYIGVFEPTEK